MIDMSRQRYRAAFVRATCAVICALVLACAGVGWAATYTVDDGGDFVTTYGRASDGDTIVVNGRANINDVDSSAGYAGAPFKIEKRLTIRGGTGSPNLYLRRGGMIIGKDVTFSNIELLFANKRCNALFANGYTLTLDNVTLTESAPGIPTGRKVHIFAGTYSDLNAYGGKWTAPASGTAGKVIMTGSTNTRGNIYLGSMNTTWDRPASVRLATPKQENVTIYSIGARQTVVNESDFFGNTEPDPPAIDETLAQYRTTGAVSIELVEPHSSIIADCRTGGTNAALSFMPDVNSNVNLKAIRPASVTVVRNSRSQSTVAGFDATAELEDGVDIAIPATCELRMNALTSLPKVAAFAGGGTIALAPDQTLSITGTVSGTTAFRVEGGQPSGAVTLGHTYITAPNSVDGAFTFTPKVYAQADYELRRGTDGRWTIVDPSVPGDVASLTTIQPAQSSGTATFADMNSAVGHDIALTFSLNMADDAFEIGCVPFTVRVSKDGGTNYSGVATEQDTFYTATVGTHNLSFAPVSLHDAGSGHALLMVTRADPSVQVRAGTYAIQYVVKKADNAAGKDIIANYTMTVTSGSTPPPATYTVTLSGTGTGASGAGSYAAGATVQINAGSKPGYTFTGWQSSTSLSNFNASLAATSFTMPAGAVTLTATWQQNVTPPATYTVTLSGTGTGATGAGSYAAGTTVQINAGTKPGYTFTGWQSSKSLSNFNSSLAATSFTMPAGAVTLTATWQQNVTPPATYTVTLSGTGTGATGAGSYAAGATVQINAGSKPGYTFTGWQSSTSLSNFNSSLAATSFTMPAGAVTLTATWQQNVTPPSGPDLPTPPQPQPDYSGHSKYSALVDLAVSDKVWSISGTRGLTVRINVDYAFFSRIVTLDGAPLTENVDYTSYPGSTVIEIKPSALRRMPDSAEHEVVAHFSDGTAVHRFTAVDAPTDTGAPSQPSTGGSSGGGGGCSSACGVLFAAAALAAILRRRG